MSGIIDKLTSIWQSITSLGSTIINGIGGFFTSLFDYLNPFSENFILATLLDYLNPLSENFILSWLYRQIESLISIVFVPDVNLLQTRFDNMLLSISNKFGINFNSLESFTDTWNEKPITDISSNYNLLGVGVLNLKFLDTTYLIQGIDKFRPLIRGFVVFLLILYNYYQALSFIGQDPRIASHDIKEGKEFLNRKEK